jgi:uncharacterized protein involved in exopolysaccharide biosynthesis
MKRVLRFLVRLYPAWWRRRYGKELESLLEDSGSGWRDVRDLLRAAMEMQMSKWSFGRIVAVCGIAGVVLAGTAAFSRPDRFRSITVLKIPEALPRTGLSQVASTALAQPSLATIVNERNLYASERKVMPMEDVIERMRRAIRITPTDTRAITIEFYDPDASTAQQVAQALGERFSGFEVLDPPSPPERVGERKRYGLAGLGLPAGLLFGVVVALILRRRTRTAS